MKNFSLIENIVHVLVFCIPLSVVYYFYMNYYKPRKAKLDLIEEFTSKKDEDLYNESLDGLSPLKFEDDNAALIFEQFKRIFQISCIAGMQEIKEERNDLVKQRRKHLVSGNKLKYRETISKLNQLEETAINLKLTYVLNKVNFPAMQYQ